MHNFLFSVNTVVPVFLLIAIGYILSKLKIIDKRFSDMASKFVFIVALPLLLFSNVAGSDFSGVFNNELLRTIIFAFIATLITFFILIISTKKLIMNDDKKRGAFIQGSFRGNYALLGIPLIFNIVSDEGVVIASLIAAFIIPLYNVLAIVALSLHRKTSTRIMLLLIIKNPLIIATLLGIVFSALQIQLPIVITRTVDMIASLAIPLALLTIGVFFDLSRFAAQIRLTLLSALIKTMLIPLVFTPVAYLFGIRGTYLVAVYVLFGVPTAISSYIMAKGMGADDEIAGSIIILSTAISLLTFFAGIFLLKSLSLI